MSAVIPIDRTSSFGSEPAAWDWVALHEELRPKLEKVARFRYGFDPGEAEDLVQDVFENVWARRPRVKNPEAYLRTSFHHRCADAIRSARSRPDSSPEPLDESLPQSTSPESILTAIAVRGAVRRLDPSCRELVTAYVVKGERLAEIAHRAEATVTAVWKRVNRCLKRLMQWLT